MRRQLHRRLSLLPALLVLWASLSLGCAARQPAGPAFDIGALIGKKMPEVEKVLGNGQADATNPGATVFNKNEYTLRVEYLQPKGRILAYTVSFTDPNQSIKEDDKARLLEAAGLREDDTRYSIQTIEDPQKALSISGVRVTPNPVQHKVELRVKGASMVNVRYTSPSPPAVGDPASGETFMTLPPWSTQFTAATGAVVGIEAGPLQMSTGTGDVPSTTVQVIVDGKVEGEFTSTDGTAHCQVELD